MPDTATHRPPRIRLIPPSRSVNSSPCPSDIVRETRRSLRLPESGKVITAGHAPQNWHPGILSKFIAMRTLSQEMGAASVILNIDTVGGDPGLIDVPFIDLDGLPCSSPIRLFDSIPDRALGMQPACEPADLSWLAGMPDLDGEPLQRLSSAVREAGGDLSLANQSIRALMDLNRSWIGRPSVVNASRLLKTACGKWLLERMQRDAVRCSEAYNAAVSVDPDAGIRALDIAKGELPLWDVRGDQSRTARRQDLDEANVLPKALVTTAIMRLAGCDLFIHGTGGARYDALMEGWLRQWLDLDVAPFMMVTADMQLPLPDAEAIARLGQNLVAQGRRAYHDPESLAVPVDSPGPQKRAALQSIQSAPRGSEERRAAFTSMHETLATLRPDNPTPSHAIADRIRDARRTSSRRDWHVVFYGNDMLDQLADQIEATIVEQVL